MLTYDVTSESLDKHANSNPSVRLSVEVNDEGALNVDERNLDRFFKNHLQDCNL